MVVMILERVPPSLRGELTRWLIEVKAGVFVGTVSALVRDKLYERALRGKRTGGMTMIYSSNTEQGFVVRTYGRTTRRIEDFDGLFLAKTPLAG
jgi:CRISPR-associated protein Cas2